MQTEMSHKEQAISNLSKRWNEMSATKNLSGIVALYAADTLWLPPNDARSIGTDKVRETYARLFQAPNINLVHTTEKIVLTLPTDKSGGFLPQRLLTRLDLLRFSPRVFATPQAF